MPINYQGGLRPARWLRLLLAVCLAAALFGSSCIEQRPEIVGGEEEEGEERPPFLGGPPAYMNEVCSANPVYRDQFGDDPGWVEFYNPADTAVNLGGYLLADKPYRKPWTFEFGDVAIEPRGYVTVFLSGRSLPKSAPPQDSVDVIGMAKSARSWADSHSSDQGRSTATCLYEKGASIGGTLTAVDNPEWGTPIAVVMLAFANVNADYILTDSSALDLSGTNQILLRGFISKNARLAVSIPSNGVRDWEGWSAVLTGTGEENGLYVIELPTSGTMPDLTSIYMLRFANPASYRGTIEFSFTSIVARKRGGDAHAPFELNKKGGRLFLMDQEWNIRDSVAYPAEAVGLSYAKTPDRAESFEKDAWALSRPPTPNAANSNEYYGSQAAPPLASNIPQSGYYLDSLMFTLPAAGNGAVLCCETSGARPTAESALRSGVALKLKETAVVRCAQFKGGSYPSAEIVRTYIIGERRPSLPVVSIAADPVEMFDPATGLYTMGPGTNPGAPYWEDAEIPVHVDFFEGGARHAWSLPAGLAIFGRSSRVHSKKSVAITFRGGYGQKNLSYTLFPEHPRLTKFKSFILRNNGNNHGHDYIRDMLMSSLTEGLGIDYQKGRFAVVYYNGRYYGIHDMRERANARYFETNYGIDKEFIDLIRADNNTVNNGSDADYQRILAWVEGKGELSDDDVWQLGEWLDLDNFTNIFQSEIYFLDTDWPGNNMKRWRATAPPTKWKWFLYDNDFGFLGAGERVNMLEYLTGPPSGWTSQPQSTQIFRSLIGNASYREAFINRFSLLLATYFSPEKVLARIDALMSAISSEIPLDQARWGMNVEWMANEINVIKGFGRTRAAEMQGEMEAFFEISGAADLTVSSSGGGSVLVHNLPVPNGSATFKAYPAVPVAVRAVPGHGAVFEMWSDGETNAERAVAVQAGRAMSLEAVFRAVSF